MATVKRPRGRPTRRALDAIRTAYWFYLVCYVSELSERELENQFDSCARLERGLPRGTRWNKYKLGRSSPSRALLDQVEAAYPGTIRIYDHRFWEFVQSEVISPPALFEHLSRLPKQIVDLFIHPDAEAGSDFWLRGDFKPKAVFEQLRKWEGTGEITHLLYVEVLLAVIHDARNRQLEAQHFTVHVELAALAARTHQGDTFAPLAWQIEAFIFSRWLRTDYRSPRLREVVGALRGKHSGPPAPWNNKLRTVPRHSGTETPTRSFSNLHGYWAARQLSRTQS